MADQDWARPLVHWAIQAREPNRLREFYSAMFNWDIADGPIMGIPPGIGGPEPAIAGHIQPGGEHPGFALYIQVRDLRASMEQAKSLGGAVRGEPFDVPNGPTIAPIADPEGNALVLVQQ